MHPCPFLARVTNSLILINYHVCNFSLLKLSIKFVIQFKEKIKNWGEATTTSPSGRHLGHYKSLYAEPTYDKEEQEELYETFK